MRRILRTLIIATLLISAGKGYAKAQTNATGTATSSQNLEAKGQGMLETIGNLDQKKQTANIEIPDEDRKDLESTNQSKPKASAMTKSRF